MTDSVPTGVTADAFWSYAREDDENDGGRITELARHLRAEYSLLTGSTLEMFLDRESIEWGDAWRQRIDEAIAGTVFFIPIVTPRYFTREACRRELLQFVAQARRLGLEQLVLPVYYIRVAELDGDAPVDEAMATVKEFNWEDLREVRLLDPGSAAYRTAVNRLAESIARRVAEITASAASGESVESTANVDDEEIDEGEPGTLEQLAEMETRVPRATEALHGLAEATDELTRITEAAAADIEQADTQGKGFAGRLRATEQFAARMREPAERIRELGVAYAADMVAIDAGVLALLDQLKDNPEGADEAKEFITSLDNLGESSREYTNSLRTTLSTSRTMAKMSRSLRKPTGDIETGIRNIVDGQQIIEGWVRRARELGDEPSADG